MDINPDKAVDKADKLLKTHSCLNSEQVILNLLSVPDIRGNHKEQVIPCTISHTNFSYVRHSGSAKRQYYSSQFKAGENKGHPSLAIRQFFYFLTETFPDIIQHDGARWQLFSVRTQTYSAKKHLCLNHIKSDRITIQLFSAGLQTFTFTERLLNAKNHLEEINKAQLITSPALLLLKGGGNKSGSNEMTHSLSLSIVISLLYMINYPLYL